MMSHVSFMSFENYLTLGKFRKLLSDVTDRKRC